MKRRTVSLFVACFLLVSSLLPSTAFAASQTFISDVSLRYGTMNQTQTQQVNFTLSMQAYPVSLSLVDASNSKNLGTLFRSTSYFNYGKNYIGWDMSEAYSQLYGKNPPAKKQFYCIIYAKSITGTAYTCKTPTFTVNTISKPKITSVSVSKTKVAAKKGSVKVSAKLNTAATVTVQITTKSGKAVKTIAKNKQKSSGKFSYTASFKGIKKGTYRIKIVAKNSVASKTVYTKTIAAK